MKVDLRHHDPLQSRPIEILIAVDLPLVREGLSVLLSSQPDFRVVGQVHEERDAVRQLRDTTPDILLLDRPQLERSGLDLIRGLSAGRESRVCRVILLTAAIEKEDIVMLLRHGIRGILAKDSSIELIFKCIRTVHKSEVWIGRNMMTTVVEALSSSLQHGLRLSPQGFRLTRREQEILRLIVQGDTNKGIAEHLTVSEHTIKHHLTNIFDKTGASNRLELALFAMHHGLVGIS